MNLKFFVTALAATASTFAGVGAPIGPAAQAYVKASNTGVGDAFGWSVAISGDTMVIGAANEDSNASGVNGLQLDENSPGSGAVYVFVRQGASWIQQAYLKASNTRVNSAFGSAVAISGDTIVVGSYAEDNLSRTVNGSQGTFSLPDSGSAYVFVRQGTNWMQQAYLKASNAGISHYFGWSLAIADNTIVVGAYNEASSATGVNGNQDSTLAPGAGAAYVYTRNGTQWSQQAYLKASNTENSLGANDQFGWSVAVASNTIVVGAFHEGSGAGGVNGNQYDNSATNAGAAYVFARSGTNWSQQAYLKASNPGAGDLFGASVGISGNTIVVGANREDSPATGVNGNQHSNNATNSGAAYIFVRNGVNWSQQAYLKASNPGPDDNFGLAAAISGDTVVVAAPWEDSAAIGVNGSLIGLGATNSGAAYGFVRNGTNWFPLAHLKASNTDFLDLFGQAVALSGDTLVVGAHWEDSAATGVNGNQSNNSSGASGAAYGFTGIGVDRHIAVVPDGVGGYFVRGYAMPGFTYQLRRSSSLSGPWTTNGTWTAVLPGPMEFHDINTPSGRAFYRITQQ